MGIKNSLLQLEYQQHLIRHKHRKTQTVDKRKVRDDIVDVVSKYSIFKKKFSENTIKSPRATLQSSVDQVDDSL